MTDCRRGICGLCYHSAGCGTIVHFDDDGKIDRLEPDPDVPLGSVLCPIADSAKEIVYSDERLLHPLRRNGPKGRHEFERISWNDAFGIIVEQWMLGFEEFAEYVKGFDPATVSRITDVGKHRIEALAREIHSAEGASYIMYTGLEYSKCGVQSIRAVMVLWAIAGQLDVIGGRGFLMRGNGIPIPLEKQVKNPGYERSIGADKFPVYAHYCQEPHASLIPDAVLKGDPYKLRSLIVLGASLATSWPAPHIWRRTLAALDFLVCIDRQMTADAAFADLVLPAATGFEIESYCYYYCSARIRERMIEPIGESRSDYEIITELADRLGYGDLYPRHSEDVLARFLTNTGFTVQEWKKAEKGLIRNCHEIMETRKWEKGLLRADGEPGFETPSGRIEIRSSILEQYGHPGLPIYEESEETAVSQPNLARRFPLILGTGSMKPDMKSCFRAIPTFVERFPAPIVEINEEDAEPRGISSGDQVMLKTSRGEVVMRAFVTDRIKSGVAYAAVGGGGPLGTEEWKQSNVNELTDPQQFDPISGFPVYKVLMCEITRKRRVRRGVALQSATQGCSG